MRKLIPSFYPVSFDDHCDLGTSDLIKRVIVGEKDEVSIKDVADSIVKAMDFQGEYAVSI
jgi:hypothetical protein